MELETIGNLKGEALLPEIKPLTESLFTNDEPDAGELFDAFLKHAAFDETGFFKVPMLDQLRRQPYHCVELEGSFNLKALAGAHRAKLFRSEAWLNKKGKP